jgi:hypothetical protein
MKTKYELLRDKQLYIEVLGIVYYLQSFVNLILTAKEYLRQNCI